jgi:hypothetical protein
MFYDTEANVWCAFNDDIPMALEHSSFDKLIKRVKLATPEILELNNHPTKCILRFVSDRKEVVD